MLNTGSGTAHSLLAITITIKPINRDNKDLELKAGLDNNILFELKFLPFSLAQDQSLGITGMTTE